MSIRARAVVTGFLAVFAVSLAAPLSTLAKSMHDGKCYRFRTREERERDAR